MTSDQPQTGAGEQPEQPEQLGLLWLRPEPGAGAPRRAEAGQAAAAVADRDGLDAVSVTTVARELGVPDAAVAAHVRFYTDLPDLLLETGFSRVQLPPFPSGDWRADLRLLATELWAVLQRHPWLAVLAHTRPLFAPSAMAVVDFGLAALSPLGLEPAEAAMYAGMVTGCGYGAALAHYHEEAAMRQLFGGAPPASPHDVIRPFLDQVMASGRYPHLSAFLRAGSPHAQPDEAFEAMLDCLLDGIAARTNRDADGSVTASRTVVR